MLGPYRITMLLALTLCGLGAYLYFIDVPASQELEQKTYTDRQILPFDDREVTHLTIATQAEKLVFVRESPRRWRIAEPLDAPADSHEVRKVLRALTVGKVERVIQESTQDEAQYGLKPPRMSLTLSTGNQTEEIDLGNPGPISATLYARKHSDGKVLLTTLDLLAFRKKSLQTFRKKQVLAFNRRKVETIQLDMGEKPIILHRQAGVHSISPNWSFRSPIEGPADKTKVGLLLMALEELEAVGFVDDQSEKQQLMKKLGRPAITATVSSKKHQQQVKVYRLEDKSAAYAMTSKANPLYQINPHLVADLTKGLFDLRDKRLLGMEIADLAILRVTTPKESYALINQSGEWILEDDPSHPLSQDVVRLFVSRVVGLPAELTVAEKASSLKTLGLASPSFEFIATDRKGRERGTLFLGKRERGLVYAMGAGLPGIHQARSNILTQIPSRTRLIKVPNN